MSDIRYHRTEESTPFTIIEAQRNEIIRLRAALRWIATKRRMDTAAAQLMSQTARDALAGRVPAEARKRVR